MGLNLNKPSEIKLCEGDNTSHQARLGSFIAPRDAIPPNSGPSYLLDLFSQNIHHPINPFNASFVVVSEHAVSLNHHLVPSDIRTSSLVLHPDFARRAFPSRFDRVRVVYDGWRGYNMGLHWVITSRFFGVELTGAWRTLVSENFLIAGRRLYLTVHNVDETTIFASMLPVQRES
ncbi:hypothetical protein PIB30_097861 [Stylosanthes scabra]|uniref:TF-B3 domain-containing protein n=1 Tax=Stylosanthes scabra TaxID=79078 RepID=A0ABU6QYX7_9FABA|nr:hypothetical protein [Stylosanthes scabra]